MSTGADHSDRATPVGVADGSGIDPGADDAARAGADDVLGRDVALVRLPAVTGPALDARRARVQGMARLHHPHLPEVLDVHGLDDDTESVLVLENVPGRRLDAILAAGPRPLAWVAAIGARLAAGLAHAHDHGMVHGRIGPASVVVDDEQARLVGFTAALRGPAATTTAADVRALAATLAAAVDRAGADRLDPVLAPATAGALGAAELSERLVRLARESAATVRVAPVPAPVGTTVRTGAGVRAGAGVGARTGVGAASAPVGPARVSGRWSPRIAALGAVAAAVMLVSGVVAWQQVGSRLSAMSGADTVDGAGPPAAAAPADPADPDRGVDGTVAPSTTRPDDPARGTTAAGTGSPGPTPARSRPEDAISSRPAPPATVARPPAASSAPATPATTSPTATPPTSTPTEPSAPPSTTPTATDPAPGPAPVADLLARVEAVAGPGS